MARIPVIISTDPGIDDAAALGMAFYRPELDVRLITTLHGNVDIDKTTANALKLVTFYGQDTPVARGMETPLFQPVVSTDVHGESGMDGYDFPESTHRIIEEHAVEAMRSLLEASGAKITLVSIGPLTNIAMLLLMYPHIKSQIDRIVLMGGSLSGGNVTSAAEFNIWADPHAAQIVFDSGVDMVMIGLDVTLKALIGEEELDPANKQSQTAEMFDATFRHYRDGDMENGVVMHDMCAITYLTNPEIFHVEPKRITVITEGPAKGMTMEINGELNIRVATGIDQTAFKSWFAETLDRMK
ncbi:ribonucleoside hydrolase RihC [Paenibacillus sp.]|jgi:non-specific riboncleoside hydrolase|uniref:ribonucleoside hydrolase RihC n=1 Tax=Paenibacillus sp. TaxID=58172 RepID=UPI0028244B92|nr:ribonucleoside hydrolase RihC [Paenibacillus sp.]MDR0267124.1 ribonucleoside hydrolase RihC [Paenibacillus sp.]